MEIIKITELIGRTIVDATMWSDNSTMSIVLDNGAILQLAVYNPDDHTGELHYEIETSPGG